MSLHVSTTPEEQKMPNKVPHAKTLSPLEGAGILAQSEALFTSMGDGAIATDEFGRIVRINPVAQKILGYTEKESVGEWFPKIVVALDQTLTPVSLIDRPITKAFLTGKSISEKMMYRTKSGDYRPVAVTVSPILLNNRPIGAIEVFRDITLEQEVDRMKSEFISLASHQLRTPLSAIKTYSHMLIDGYMGDLVPAQKKALRTILGASNRMNELVNMLLNVTRIESGSIATNPKIHNMCRLAEEVVRELHLSAAEKHINIELNLPTTHANLRTDNLIAKEILINLVSNAVKYTPENGKVTVSLTCESDKVTFGVTDTGVGIPKFSQDHVFTKFFRAENVVKKETTGTGLGLYLVKGLVDTLGGKVWFESEENKGSSFYFSLPKHHKDSASKQLEI
jgi:PAS domain S-box-containing protein